MTTEDSRAATELPAPKGRSLPASITRPARHPAAPIVHSLAGHDTLSDHLTNEAQCLLVAEGQAVSQHQPRRETQRIFVLADPVLEIAAATLDDIERAMLAAQNRLRQLTRTGADKDGGERGFGLDATHPDIARLAELTAMLERAEHQASLNLERIMRRHPLGPWVRAQRGIGDRQAARLLAAIGDPYCWEDTGGVVHVRRVSDLRSYCGYGDAARQKRRKGQQINWNADAKQRAHNIAVSCVKNGAYYREVYDKARARYADAVHAEECIRCGPKGKPALPGSPLSAAHQNGRALRAVAKEILRDLWREAKRLHEVDGDA